MRHAGPNGQVPSCEVFRSAQAVCRYVATGTSAAAGPRKAQATCEQSGVCASICARDTCVLR